jgi:chromosome partitioning protein
MTSVHVPVGNRACSLQVNAHSKRASEITACVASFIVFTVNMFAFFPIKMLKCCMTKVISVGNMKGGVGKTTSAVHIAQHLGRKGQTLLLDADEKLQSAVEWCGGTFDGWTFDTLPYRDMTPEITAPYEYVVIDTKGNEQGDDLVNLAQHSDLLIVPTKADGTSARGLIRTLKPLAEAGITNYRVLIVANVGGRGEELRHALAEQDVPVLTTLVRHSTAVGDAAELQISLDAYTSNRYAKLVALDYSSVGREVLSHV